MKNIQIRFNSNSFEDGKNSDLFRRFKTSILKGNDNIAVKFSYTKIEGFCYLLKHENNKDGN